jgi:gamma-glutamyltranspeptidase/glutathione hydrolase
MLSSMTPTIVERRTESFYDRWFPWRFDDYYSVLQTILNVYEYNFSMQEAVNAPDFTINGYRSDYLRT